MKTRYILTAIAAAIIFTTQISCTKEAQSPSVAGGGNLGNKNTVTHSDWFSAQWQTTNLINEYSKNDADITVDLLKNGKVLVFGKGGFEERQTTILPSFCRSVKLFKQPTCSPPTTPSIFLHLSLQWSTVKAITR